MKFYMKTAILLCAMISLAYSGNGDIEAEYETIVIGAGPTGLCAAYHLGEKSLLLEQDDRVGGVCRSEKENGFIFDHATHVMFSLDPYVLDLYEKLLGDNVRWQDREAWIFSKGVHTRYPFQSHLYGLPPGVIKECLVGAIEARLEFVKKEGEGSKKVLEDCCVDGVMGANEPTCQVPPPQNYEDFIYEVWGEGIGKHFAIPYNTKVWACPVNQIETSWLKGRVPLPNLEEIIEGAVNPSVKPVGPNARFGYPIKGGFEALMQGFLPLLKGELRLKSRVVAISPKDHTVTLEDGTMLRYHHLISTMPLPVLIKSLQGEIPTEVEEAGHALQHTSVRCINIGIGREDLTFMNWIYYPEEEVVFQRIFVPGNASPFCCPPGGSGLICEISYSKYRPLPCSDEELIERCIGDCQKVGLIKEDDPILYTGQIDIPYAYVLYTQDREQHVNAARSWLEQNDIFLAGRYSEWKYYNSDHAFVSGKEAAEKVLLLNRELAKEDF